MGNDSEPIGATPGDDLSGLLRTDLIERRDRDAVELEAIDQAYREYIFKPGRKALKDGWFSDEFIRGVHLDMFGTIWDWAGKYRTTELNLGVAPHLIPEQIQLLCGDFKYWSSREGSMDIIEIAARMQNRLTKIHPFRNGNGRHARLMTDIFLSSRGHPLPRWPQVQLMTDGHEIRECYIEAMKAADNGDYSKIIAFMNEYLDRNT